MRSGVANTLSKSEDVPRPCLFQAATDAQHERTRVSGEGRYPVRENVGIMTHVAGRFGPFRESGPIPRKGMRFRHKEPGLHSPRQRHRCGPCYCPTVSLPGVRFSGRFAVCLAPHGFLKQSLGQRQRLAFDLAVRQRLLESRDTIVTDSKGPAKVQDPKVLERLKM